MSLWPCKKDHLSVLGVRGWGKPVGQQTVPSRQCFRIRPHASHRQRFAVGRCMLTWSDTYHTRIAINGNIDCGYMNADNRQTYRQMWVSGTVKNQHSWGFPVGTTAVSSATPGIISFVTICQDGHQSLDWTLIHQLKLTINSPLVALLWADLINLVNEFSISA